MCRKAQKEYYKLPSSRYKKIDKGNNRIRVEKEIKEENRSAGLNCGCGPL